MFRVTNWKGVRLCADGYCRDYQKRKSLIDLLKLDLEKMIKIQ